MCRYFVLITFFFILVSGQEYDFYVFSKDKKSLTKCVEDYLLKVNDPFFQKNGTAKEIADLLVNKFIETSKTKNEFTRATFTSYYYLKHCKNHLFKKNQNYRPLLDAMRAALKNCADIPSPAPVFTDEPRELADVLDFILVDLSDDVQVPNDVSRFIMAAYARDALKRLDTALNYIGNFLNFRDVLRRLWRHRAQLCYDGRSNQLPLHSTRLHLRKWFTHIR